MAFLLTQTMMTVTLGVLIKT